MATAALVLQSIGLVMNIITIALIYTIIGKEI
jgi:hypothetical protein